MSSNHNSITVKAEEPECKEYDASTLDQSDLRAAVEQLSRKCDSLSAENRVMRQQIDGLSNIAATVQQQRVVLLQAPDMLLDKAVTDIARAHKKYEEGRGFDYSRTFNAKHNVEVKASIAAFCRSSLVGNETLDESALSRKIHQYFAGQKKELKKRRRGEDGEEVPCDRQAKRRYKRKWTKIHDRKAAWERLEGSVKEHYEDGDKLLCQECMSPEVSDTEMKITLRKPGFRTARTQEFLDRLDEVANSMKKGRKQTREMMKKETDFEVVLSESTKAKLPEWAQ